jgi:hypothetical protein
MRIVESCETALPPVTFGQLKIGDVFDYAGTIYLKVSSSDGMANAVDLTNNTTTSFGATGTVVKLLPNARLVKN